MTSYRLEVIFWTRSHDGDDWITGEHWWYYPTLQEAIIKAENPFSDNKGLISSNIYSIVDGKRELIYTKEWDG
jgi:hypothetical protein